MADNVIVRVPEQQFIRGEDGYSPEVTIENIDHGHSVNITDREHPEGQTFNVLDGDSAYEQAVAGGYTGTEAQFNEELASFKELSEQAADSANTAAGAAFRAQNYERHAGDAEDAARAYADIALIRMNSADQSAQNAAGSASNASRDAGTVSAAATTATEKAGEASDSATAADGSAKDSEAYAVGKRGGTDVGSADPAYHNNAKYYAQQASGSASDAATAKGAAETAQGLAESAQTAAETAQGKAEDAQAAAEAVLASIPSDYTELSGDVDDLKSAVDILGISTEQLTVTNNRYYNLSAASITIGSPTQLNDYECAVIPCAEGDIFYVSCVGQSKSRAWGYVDAEGTVLSRASANVTAVNVYTSAPANSAYLILNNLKASNVTMSARKVSAKYLTTTYTADKRLFNGADLDTLTSDGTYFMQSASDAINTPIATIGKIIVLAMRPRSPLNYLLQIFITVSGRIFTRSNFDRSIWSDWTELASKQNLADAMSETVNNSKDITIPDSANIEQNKLLDFTYGYIRLVNSALWDTTDYIGVEDVDLTYFAFQKIRIAEYTEDQQALKVVDVQEMATINFLPQTKYIRISFYKPDNAKADIAILCLDASTKKAISAVYNALDKSSLSYARHNAIAAANQMAKIEWTPIQPIPVTNSAGYVGAGTKCVGLPYSSTRSVCKYIGQHLSIYTFMSALQNPRSVLYTRRIKYGTLGKTYYGITCFTFTSYSAGSQLGKFDNEISRMFDGSNVEISPYEIQPGDTLQLTYDRETLPDPNSAATQPYQHCILIYDVSKDAFGRIRTVQLAEATSPFALIHNTITFDSFMSSYITGGFKYKVYRKNGRLDYGAYKAINDVKGYGDEEPDEVVYPDIMPEYGDKACVEAGTTVAINVINAKSYTQIQIIKNGTVIETKNSIADFNMPSMSAGTYKFRLTDGTNTSESSLIVADVNGSYDANTKKVTFSSSNATPVFAASYITTSDLKGVQNKVKYFTAEEQTQGWADVSDIVGQYYDAVQIGFLTEYGVAMWRSTPLADEWEYWTPPTS